MRVPAAWPAAALIAGACVGVLTGLPPSLSRLALLLAIVATCVVWRRGTRTLIVCAALVFASGGALLARHDRDAALSSSLRQTLDEEFGGFRLDTLGPEGAHPPLLVRALLVEDASSDPPGAQLRVRVRAVRLHGTWMTADGGVSVSIAGAVQPAALSSWRAGRMIQAPVTFRRPARYYNPGVPDFERALALNGTTLFASVKSGLLVDVVSSGSWTHERAASIRAVIRGAVSRWVRPHSPVSAAIVAAILIGDRTGLPDEVRERLQDAGVYHVLAISGGNIAILVGAALLAGRLAGITGRLGTVLTLMLLMAYAQVVIAGPSVFRAVVMAATYLIARALDHRAPPWQAVAVAAALTVAIDPLDVLDAGFLLTFAATGALLSAVRYMSLLRSIPVFLRWPLAAMLASVATELVLLPIGAAQFGRVTFVGILLNLVAIPLMTVAQIAGFSLGLGWASDMAGAFAGWVAHLSAAGLVESARLADVLPWLATRVPQPSLITVCVYYAAGAAVFIMRGRLRGLAALVTSVAAILIVTGRSLLLPTAPSTELQLTMFDVGQGESMRMSFPGDASMVIDTGGAPFGGGSFDIGDRVLRPALWTAGIRRIEHLLVTHGDPDHIGGAPAIVESFTPGWLLAGVPVPGHAPFAALSAAAKAGGADVRELYAGDTWTEGDVRVRVLSPERPDWERRRVRNDDSIVLEVRRGDVAFLLTGDISAEVEARLVPRLQMAPVRVLKVAHHGSRTSTSQLLLDAWKPQVALISCGRGNRFGHPAPEVLERLQRAGVRVYRTDINGAITVTADAKTARVTTMLP